LTDQGDWFTMQMLKNDIDRLKKLGWEEHRFEIEAYTEHLNIFKKRALIEGSN
jgi:hypothetical protein